MIKCKKSEKIFCEISVTNLIDVLFVLLLIFMISASSVAHSNVPVNLPETSSREKAQQSDIEISVPENGEILIGERKFNNDSLSGYLKKIAYKKNAKKIIIRADGNVEYEMVERVMDTARMAGFESVSLATKEIDGKLK